MQIDYNDPQVLPRRVQEINYILPDENMLVNLEDALLTDPSFYSLRNEVMLMHHMWENSGRDDSLLMASLRKSKFCLKQRAGAFWRRPVWLRIPRLYCCPTQRQRTWPGRLR